MKGPAMVTKEGLKCLHSVNVPLFSRDQRGCRARQK